MITLSIIAYVIISLIIARHKYNDWQFDSNYGQVNSCYQNGKKSLIHGFLYLPVLAISIYAAIMIIIGLCKIFVTTVTWIFVNMP
jgi:hypothetical protein